MKSILFTGGLGDVIAVESLMTDEERSQVHCIFYATRASEPCIELFEGLKTFPNLKKQSIIWRDFSSIFCFHNKEQLTDKLCAYQANALQAIVRDLMLSVDDYSIQKIFPEDRPYISSSFIKETLADISKFNLPPNYYVICPYTSNDKRDIRRDYNNIDWEESMRLLRDRGMFGIIINKGDEKVPENVRLINLSNQTNAREAIEIMKKAHGYIGIDSAFSVIAAKLFPAKNLVIKSLNNHCYKWKHVYFAPHKDFAFLRETIKVQ